MKFALVSPKPTETAIATAGFQVPSIIADAGDHARSKFIEFFTAGIRNPNTRMAYARAVGQFLDWCFHQGLGLHELEPFLVAAYIEELGTIRSKPTVKQHLAAIRMLFDWLVIGQVIPMNPASSVRGPKYVTKQGKTPVLSAEEARQLLDTIDTSNVSGLRDRALIATMIFSFARVGAVVAMNVEDYFPEGKRWWLRLHEKGGKHHRVPVHHTAEEYLDQYLKLGFEVADKKLPLFRTVDKQRELTGRRMTRYDAARMVKRRAKAVGLPDRMSCHTFRATGITAYLDNGGTIEHAQAIAAHESPRTTKLYDRTGDKVTLDEIERILI